MLEAKESEAKLAVGKLKPPWLENTLFLLNLFFSKPHLLLFPSWFLYPHYSSLFLSAVLLFFFLPLLLIFLPLSLLRSPFQSPSVNSSLSICYSVLFLFPSPTLTPRLTQSLCHLFLLSIFLFSHSSIPSGVSSSLSVWCFSYFQTTSLLTPAVTPRPLKSTFPPFSLTPFLLVHLLIYSQMTTFCVKIERKQSKKVSVSETNSEEVLSVLH